MKARRAACLALAVLFLALFLMECASSDDDSSTGSDQAPTDDDDASADDTGGADDSADDDVTPPDHPYIKTVVDYTVGVSGGYGEDFLPDSLLGAPAGFGLNEGNNDADQVFSLGHGGSITVEMETDIADGDGPDFTIFENAFRVAQNENVIFTEAAFVEVSEDGVEFTRFPNDYEPADGGDAPQAYPGNFSGFAGIVPVTANLDPNDDGGFSDYIDPGDPSVSGGDLLDLADVGLSRARFVRVIDTGSAVRAPGTETYDDDGTLIEDQGNLAPLSGNKDGFDLDAIVVLNAADSGETGE